MAPVTVRFLGSGDAFGDGGRFQACILLSGGPVPLLLDCGATSLVAMKRAGVDPSSLGHVVLSHLHGDHFGGLPFLVLDGQFSRRERPLEVAGPPGTRDRLRSAMEVLFPGSSTAPRRFETSVVELEPGVAAELGPASVTPFLADHASGAPAFCLRIEYGGKVIAYTGDTAWSESIVEAARGSDLLIAEAYTLEKQVPFHLAHATLAANLDRIEARRLILTHPGPEMLAAPSQSLELAHDGLALNLP